MGYQDDLYSALLKITHAPPIGAIHESPLQTFTQEFFLFRKGMRHAAESEYRPGSSIAAYC